MLKKVNLDTPRSSSDWGKLHCMMVGNNLFAPTFKKGDALLLDNEARCEKGDPVAVTLKNGDIYIGFLKAKANEHYVFETAGRDSEDQSLHALEIKSIQKLRAAVYA